MALETALEDIPVVSMPTVHSLKKGIFGVLLCGTTTHFKVAYYCESKHCAPIMLFNQHLNKPYLPSGLLVHFIAPGTQEIMSIPISNDG